MSKSLYMHTMDGKPAFFQDGWLVYAGNEIPRLEKSLYDIRQNEAICARNRRKAGFDIDFAFGYIRIKKAGIPRTNV